MQSFVNLHANKTNFHMKGFALGLALEPTLDGVPGLDAPLRTGGGEILLGYIMCLYCELTSL